MTGEGVEQAMGGDFVVVLGRTRGTRVRSHGDAHPFHTPVPRTWTRVFLTAIPPPIPITIYCHRS